MHVDSVYSFRKVEINVKFFDVEIEMLVDEVFDVFGHACGKVDFTVPYDDFGGYTH